MYPYNYSCQNAGCPGTDFVFDFSPDPGIAGECDGSQWTGTICNGCQCDEEGCSTCGGGGGGGDCFRFCFF